MEKNTMKSLALTLALLFGALTVAQVAHAEQKGDDSSMQGEGVEHKDKDKDKDKDEHKEKDKD
jgi:hypothetical protein